MLVKELLDLNDCTHLDIELVDADGIEVEFDKPDVPKKLQKCEVLSWWADGSYTLTIEIKEKIFADGKE